MRLIGKVTSLFFALICCSLPVNAHAQSFSCRSAKTPDEIAICQNRVLSKLDEQMVTLFLARRAALSESQQALLTAQQQLWLRERMICAADVSCIENAYSKRISQLTPFGTITTGPASQPGSSSNTILAPLQKDGGTYVVPVLINKAITLPFTVDSGAADVVIPADVFATLVRAGTIQDSDLLGTKTYKFGDGSTRSEQTFRLRSLTLGGKVIENVAGSVAPVEGPLLLGQTFLERFKSWSIDNAKQALVLQLQDSEVAQNGRELSPQDPQNTAKRRFRVYDVSDGFLQLRKGPGPQYEEVTKIPEGAMIMVGRCVPLDGGWKPFCEVEWQGVRGWASSCCMDESKETTQFSYRVTQNLILRSGPDKSSWNMLTNYAPRDYIPEGQIFTWKSQHDAGNCTSGRGGEIWCHLSYIHDGGIKTDGWVSAHFLRSTATEMMLACLFQTPDPDCAIGEH